MWQGYYHPWLWSTVHKLLPHGLYKPLQGCAALFCRHGDKSAFPSPLLLLGPRQNYLSMFIYETVIEFFFWWLKKMTDVDTYNLNKNKMLTKLESCGGTTVTSWCKLQISDESQMLAGICTKRTVFIVTAWLSQWYVQYKMMKLTLKLFIKRKNKPKSLGV